MKTTQKINLDLTKRGISPHIHAVQGDLYTRMVELSLSSGSIPWHIPDDIAVLIRYRKPDHTVGIYDTLPNGKRAYSVSGNVITFTITPDALSLDGDVPLIISLIRGQQVLSTFEMTIHVQANHGNEPVSTESGCNIFGILAAPQNAKEGQILAVEATDDTGAVRKLKAIDLPTSSGESGKDGISVTHQWNGTILSVTSASGTSAADLKGEKGDIGPQGQPGETGAPGPQGPQGKQGADGLPGKDGTNGKDGADGTDGITPHIGENGNWFIGETDTGKPSRGENGNDGADGQPGKDGANGKDGADGKDGENGKSAYAYAQEGGFTGTEEEFAEKLAADFPEALKNPHALTINGTSYDGSESVSMTIQGGNGSGGITIKDDGNGNVEITSGGTGGGSGGGVSSWNDLTDKPFGSEVAEILPETTVEIDPEMGAGVIPVEKVLVEGGKEYTVNFNGVEYVTSCLKIEEDGALGFALGNAGVVVEGLPVNTDPFVVIYGPELDENDVPIGWMCMVAALDGSASVTLSIEQRTITKIEEQFLPDSSIPFWVDVTTSLTGPVTDVNWRELYAAYKMGRIIIARYYSGVESNRGIFHLEGMNADGMSFLNATFTKVYATIEALDVKTIELSWELGKESISCEYVSRSLEFT